MFKAALAAKGVGGADDEEHPDVEAVEWCESLTQGHAPQGSYEISAKGPRCVGCARCSRGAGGSAAESGNSSRLRSAIESQAQLRVGCCLTHVDV